MAEEANQTTTEEFSGRFVCVGARPRRYRCSKGHEWEAAAFGPASIVAFPGIIEGQFCLRCLGKLVALWAGTVTEVKG